MEPPSTYLADEKLPKVTDLLNSTKPDGFKIRVAYSSAKCSVNYVAPEKPLDDLLDSLTVKTDAKKEEDQLFEYVLEIYTVPTTEASVLWAKGHEYYPFNDTLDCYGKSLFQKLTFFSPTIALTDAEELFNIVEHDPKATKPQNLSKESNIGVYFDWVPEFGQVYEIHCRKLTKTNEKVEEEGCTIQASYNQSELQRLYDRAVNFSAQEFRKRHPPSKTARITKAYRVKKREYFENIRIGDTEFGVMEPHVKNNHGHHENNINHFLEGTFFSTQVQYNGNQPNFSYFGDTKMVVGIATLLEGGHQFVFCGFLLQRHKDKSALHDHRSMQKRFKIRLVLRQQTASTSRPKRLFADSRNEVRYLLLQQLRCLDGTVLHGRIPC
uniref:PHYHIP_C domain-containing protein n=1 Tax=Panagrellus redivivus TaxID=6233 RepID=A0A7E4W6C7_PANRE